MNQHAHFWFKFERGVVMGGLIKLTLCLLNSNILKGNIMGGVLTNEMAVVWEESNF